MHWGFPPIIGGVETHLTVLLPELVNMGHHVTLLTGSVEGVKARYMFKGVHIQRTPLFDLNWLFKRGLAGLDDEIKKLYSDFFRKVRPDVVHVHNMHYFSKNHTRFLKEICMKKGIPLILTAHNVWDDILFLQLTRDTGWDHIVAVSHYIKKELIGAGIDDNKITVVHHGIDPFAFHPGGKPRSILKKHPDLKGRKIVFHPARMGLAKGCDISIKAIRLVKETVPDVLLVMAGTKNIIDWGTTQEKEIAYFVDLVKIFNLQQHVYIDFFPLEDMPQMYNLSKICLYPSSVSEPFGLTMLEAMAAHKPMIVTRMGGMPEIIQDGITGYVVPVKDFEVLASRIVDLLVNEKMRKRLGFTGQSMVRRHYTTRIMTESVLEIYYNLLKKKA